MEFYSELKQLLANTQQAGKICRHAAAAIGHLEMSLD